MSPVDRLPRRPATPPERRPERVAHGPVGGDRVVVEVLAGRGVEPPGGVAERAGAGVVRGVPGGHGGEAAHAVALVDGGERPVLEPLAVGDGEEGVVGDELVVLGGDGGGLAEAVGVRDGADVGDVLRSD